MAIFRVPKKNRRVAPALMVFMWFGGAVMLGTVLLWLPFSHTSHRVDLDFSAALFTAVSAACVTGLSVVNLHDTFSPFGQVVIFLLMEIGGIGIMSFASLGFRILGRRLSLSQQAATADSIYQNDAANEFKRTFVQILKVTLAVQAIGAAIMAFSLAPRHWHTPGERGFMIWSAVFHSVSAFCNSGFTLYQDDLHSLVDNIPFLVTLLALVTLGGLGHIVLNELYRLPGYIRNHVKKPHWISLHTRVVLSMTALLITLGIAFIWALGSGAPGNPLWQAVFATVSGRTAGFSISPTAMLPLPSVIVMLFLMFAGGSPGSCAGGIKTTSL
ncbi:MAG: ATPase, partial [Planctomycetota bacterium]|nr:ATPase [Planctomycetota bacterium]